MSTGNAKRWGVAWTVALMAASCRSVPYNPNPVCPACPPATPVVTSDCAGELPPAAPAPRRPVNLVFEGGGVKGAAYAGALAVLERNGSLASVERVAGTSAGSIVALLVALGYTPAEVLQVLLDLDFSRFKDGRELQDVRRLFSQFGWYKGDFALCTFECMIEKKTGSRHTTFAQLRAARAARPGAGLRDLHVFGTDVNAHRWVEFSAETTPDMELAQAVRTSMSIPFFFAARRLDGRVLVDGGALINYPIEAFDRLTPVAATLGLHLGTAPTSDPIDGLLSYTKRLFQTLMDTQTDILCATPRDVRRSVFINPLGIAATDFAITRQQKCALVREGIRSTDAYLRADSPPESCPTWITSLRPVRPAAVP